MSCSEGWNLNEFTQKSMKARTILAVAAAAITLTSSALGDKYSDLVAKGYRWTTADGLYACVSKDDVRRMVNNPTDEFNEFDLTRTCALAKGHKTFQQILPVGSICYVKDPSICANGVYIEWIDPDDPSVLSEESGGPGTARRTGTGFGKRARCLYTGQLAVGS